MLVHRWTLRASLFGAAALLAGASVQAGSHHGQRGAKAPRGGPYVVAESRFGHGTVAGPVRRTRLGYEVRLPGGSWIPCRRSCSETLRVETVDFFENKGKDAIDNECGAFGCLSRSFGY
ncbi:MAG: hypothetical protein ACREC6_12900 [Hyphomicrobiaceae bacterium]